MPVASFTGYGKVHQYTTIQAGQNATVLRFNISRNMIGFLTHVGNNYWNNTYYRWVIDGEVIEEKVERMIGSPQNLHKFNPPYVAKSYIEFRGFNNDNVEREFEVIIQGELHDRKPSFEVLQ